MVRPLVLMSGTLALLGLSACPTPEAPPGEEGFGGVHVTVEGIPSFEGQLLVAVFVGPEGFPGEISSAHSGVARKIDSRRMEFEFADVPAGPIAVSVLHDVNENFELDTNLFGIPKEDWGVSGINDGFFGPPSFGSTSLTLRAGERLAVRIPLSKVVDE